jgi:hypothetical protein
MEPFRSISGDFHPRLQIAMSEETGIVEAKFSKVPARDWRKRSGKKSLNRHGKGRIVGTLRLRANHFLGEQNQAALRSGRQTVGSVESGILD